MVLTNCSTNHFNLALPPTYMQLFLLRILHISMVNPRLNLTPTVSEQLMRNFLRFLPHP